MRLLVPFTHFISILSTFGPGISFELLLGNIFICHRDMSGTGEGESEEEDDGRTSSGVVYKIGI